MTDQAFTERIVSMQETLYRVSYSLLPQPADREDAVQESIRKAWQKRGNLRDVRYMETWVVRILINECYAAQKKRRREFPVEALPARITPEGCDPFQHEMFMNLEESLRLPAVLYYIEEYSVQDIAHMLRLPAGTVKSRLHRARERIKKSYYHDLLGNQEVIR